MSTMRRTRNGVRKHSAITTRLDRLYVLAASGTSSSGSSASAMVPFARCWTTSEQKLKTQNSKKRRQCPPAATARGRHPRRGQGGSARAGSHSRAYPAAFENSCELRVTRPCLLHPPGVPRFWPLPRSHFFFVGVQDLCLSLVMHLPSCTWWAKGPLAPPPPRACLVRLHLPSAH